MRKPEAAEHDAFEDEFEDLRKDLLEVCSGEESDCEGLGKMVSLLEKAREIASRAGTEGRVN